MGKARLTLKSSGDIEGTRGRVRTLSVPGSTQHRSLSLDLNIRKREDQGFGTKRDERGREDTDPRGSGYRAGNGSRTHGHDKSLRRTNGRKVGRQSGTLDRRLTNGTGQDSYATPGPRTLEGLRP